ncbi:MAG: hypothetical protein E6I80_18675 [Chloroflexi bacterium]|nr:MAG: hypothetical protein E6I80_18675 [Chloroflexota bacterium]
MIPTLHIHLLGDFRLVSGETPVTTITVPRVQSLLAYLVLHRTAPQDRSHLAFLLWPDSTEAQAHTNLRQLLMAPSPWISRIWNRHWSRPSKQSKPRTQP